MAVADFVENVDLMALGLAGVMVGEGVEGGVGLSLILEMWSLGVDSTPRKEEGLRLG